jgi:hypothetical protein
MSVYDQFLRKNKFRVLCRVRLADLFDRGHSRNVSFFSRSTEHKLLKRKYPQTYADEAVAIIAFLRVLGSLFLSSLVLCALCVLCGEPLGGWRNLNPQRPATHLFYRVGRVPHPLASGLSKGAGLESTSARIMRRSNTILIIY